MIIKRIILGESENNKVYTHFKNFIKRCYLLVFQMARKKRGLSRTSSSRLFEKQLSELSDQELKELLLINMYKLALVRAQLEAITSILIRNKLTTFEEVWKETNKNFKDSI